MKRTRKRYGLALGAALVVLGASSGACAQPPAAAPPPPELSQEAKDEAKRLYEEGQKAVDSLQWEKARGLFAKAWRIRQIWQIAASLGQAEFKTHKYRDAAEHLTFVFKEAQAELETPAAQPERKRLREMLEKARAKVGALNITVNPAGAEVLVGGQVVGKAPLPAAVFVEPGLVLVEARREGYAAAREERTAVAGQEQSVPLALSKVAARGGPATLPPVIPGSDASPGRRKRVAGFVIGGVGVAGIAVGAVTGIMAIVKHGELYANCPGPMCDKPSDPDISSAGRALTYASTAAFAIGIAGLGVGTYLVISSRAETKSSVALTFLPGGGGLTARTSF